MPFSDNNRRNYGRKKKKALLACLLFLKFEFTLVNKIFITAIKQQQCTVLYTACSGPLSHGYLPKTQFSSSGTTKYYTKYKQYFVMLSTHFVFSTIICLRRSQCNRRPEHAVYSTVPLFYRLCAHKNCIYSITAI